jgi:hypothetical protein
MKTRVLRAADALEYFKQYVTDWKKIPVRLMVCAIVNCTISKTELGGAKQRESEIFKRPFNLEQIRKHAETLPLLKYFCFFEAGEHVLIVDQSRVCSCASW